MFGSNRRPFHWPGAFALALLLSFGARPAHAAPADFDVVSFGGARSPRGSWAWVHVTAAGQGTYVRYRPDSLTATPLDSLAFTLTGAQVDSLWQVVNGSGFLALASAADTSARDGATATISVRANGVTHGVTVSDAALAAFDATLASINHFTPGTRDVPYRFTPTPGWTPQDGCGATLDLRRADDSVPPTKPGGAVAPAARPAPPDVTAAVNADHPGTTIAYHMSLQQAVAAGIATIESKGGFWGDQATITVDNTVPVHTNDLRLDLWLELYGPAATPIDRLAIEALIEGVWNGHTTTGGEPLNVDAHTRLAAGNTPPGTAGWHQIQLVSDTSNPTSSRSFTNVANTGLNRGAGSGTWRTSEELPQTLQYHHEAGHLFGLDDQYDDWLKRPDGTWTKDGGLTSLTSAQLAPLLTATYPGQTVGWITARLSDPQRQMTSQVRPGHETDPMGSDGPTPLQSDLDGIAAQAGLVVDIPAGTVLVNKRSDAQNLVTTRETHLFVPAGQVRTIYGLWTGCLDPSNVSPDVGDVFDVAPPLAEWTGSPAAAAMQQLIGYIDQNGLFCDADVASQWAIWDVATSGPPLGAADSLRLLAAGLAVPTPLGFPRFLDPDSSTTTTGNVLPVALFAPHLASSGPSADITAPGALASFVAPPPIPGHGFSATAAWTLVRPGGSSAALSSTSGFASSFRTDVRGHYRLQLHARAVATTDSIVFDETRDLVCADAATETFESGAIRAGAPFHWVTGGDSAWSLNRFLHRTGRACAFASAASHVSSTLSTTVVASAPGPLSFATFVSGDGSCSLRFLIDGAVLGTFDPSNGWVISTFTLPAGTHTLTWNLRRPAGPNLTLVALDDVVFPLTAQLAGAGPSAPVARGASLGAPRPNPVRDATRVSFSLARDARVRVELFDLLGRHVRTVTDGDYAAGDHDVRVDMASLPVGLYLVRLSTNGVRATRTLVRIR